MTRTFRWIVSVGLAALGVACAPQANEEYLGEPLLRMRGQVKSLGLTTPQTVLPALCFIEDMVPGTLEVSALPAEVRVSFEGAGFGAGRRLAHILDVEVEGEFPAEFNVNVYVPPPTAAIAPLFEGEPPCAWGNVCAVQAEHGDVAESVSGVGATSCDTISGPCVSTNVVMTDSGSRYYFEKADCPTQGAALEECTVTRGGEVGLLTETGGFEHVVSQAWDPEVVYLAAPAPAGSYTAYKLGAPRGLAAGYHLRTLPTFASQEDAEAYQNALLAARDQAIAETNATHGTDYNGLPDYSDETGFHLAPPDVIATFDRVSAHLEMESVAVPMRSEVSPDGPGLTLELVQDRDWFPRLPLLEP